MSKKKKFKYQLGGELYASLSSIDDTKPVKVEKAKTHVFKNKKEHDSYYLKQSLLRLSPEDRQLYDNAVAGKVTNISPESVIALRAPTPLYSDYIKGKAPIEPMGNVLGRAYGLKYGGNLKAQQGKQIITGDSMYDNILNKRDSVIQAGGARGHKDWDYFLKQGIEKVKAIKAKQLQGKIDSLNIIEDNQGQLKHPGKITKINSNKITMKGVPYPVLGISNESDKKLMFPDQEYDFRGSSVTEFPLLKNGKKLKKAQMGTSPLPNNLNWGSEDLFVPGQFTAQGQLEQFSNTLPNNNFLGDIGDKLGGPMGILNSATSLIGGIQQIGQGKKAKQQAQQAYELSELTKQVSELSPERTKRKYFRPEDQVIDPNTVMPTYGTGTNYLAKDGANLQNGGFLDQTGKFFEGIGTGRASNLGQILGSAVTGQGGVPNGGGQVGSTLGGVAGSLLGPVGGAVGSFLGGAIGGALDINAKKAEEYNRKANKNLGIAGLNQSVSSLRNSYTGFMEDGGNLRIGGHLRANKYAMGGDLETYEGGGAAPISSNPYLPDTGETVMFRGDSHEEGGIDMKFGGNRVEVEGGEPAVKLGDGLTVFGNMKIPPFGVLELNDPKAKGKKFKNYIADLSKAEDKQNKITNKNMKMIDELELSTPFDKLKFSSRKAMIKGADMRLKDIAQKKQNASIIQNAILETAEEYGLESDALARGHIKKAKNGLKIAQDGRTISRAEVEEYLKQGWQPDPSNPNRLFIKSSIPGETETINVKAPGKGGEEFNRAFAEARRKGVEEFNYRGKPYTTDLYKGAKKTINTPSTDFTDYLDIIDPMKPSPQATPQISPEISAKSKGFNVAEFINTALPYLRPSNQLGLDPNQLAGERLALASNELEPVQAQLYNPLLEQVSDISLQDQMNANQADFNSIQRTVGANPSALATLAAQKYQANSGVLGEQFRFNQQQKQGVFNRNRGTLNDAQLKNLSILDQQYVRQATAKSKTKATAQSAISSISDKIQRNKLENRTLGVYENLYNYRFGPKGYAYNLNPLADFQYPSAGDTGNQYLDGLVPIGKEPEFNSRGQLKDVGTKAKTGRNGSLVRSYKNC